VECGLARHQDSKLNMRHRPTLSVPKPCHESWQAMTPAAQGRHCAACNKVVVDFTHMTDAEVLAYVGQSVGASCGRFRSTQLDRPLVVLDSDSGASWRKRLLAAVALLGLGTAASPAAQAQQAAPIRVQRTITMGMVAQPATSPPLPPPLVVRGVVQDSATHEPLPGVTVLVAGTTIGVSSDKDGAFELVLPEFFRDSQPIPLQVSFVGYRTQHLPINPQQMEALTFNLVPDTRMLGELVVVGGYCAAPWYSPRGLWQRMKRPFQRW
jgi:hypothetical protein